jgi:hypothetical protein
VVEYDGLRSNNSSMNELVVSSRICLLLLLALCLLEGGGGGEILSVSYRQSHRLRDSRQRKRVYIS